MNRLKLWILLRLPGSWQKEKVRRLLAAEQRRVTEQARRLRRSGVNPVGMASIEEQSEAIEMRLNPDSDVPTSSDSTSSKLVGGPETTGQRDG